MAKPKETFKETLGRLAFGVFLFAVWLFLCASVLSYSPFDPPSKFVYSESDAVGNLAGLPGAWCANAIFYSFGVAGYFVLLAFGVEASAYWFRGGVRDPIMKTVGFSFLLLATSGAAAYLFDDSAGPTIGPGGCVGALVQYLLDRCFVKYGAGIALVGVLSMGAILAGSDRFVRFVFWTTGVGKLFGWLSSPFRRRLREAAPPNAPIDLTANVDFPQNRAVRSTPTSSAFDSSDALGGAGRLVGGAFGASIVSESSAARRPVRSFGGAFGDSPERSSAERGEYGERGVSESRRAFVPPSVDASRRANVLSSSDPRFDRAPRPISSASAPFQGEIPPRAPELDAPGRLAPEEPAKRPSLLAQAFAGLTGKSRETVSDAAPSSAPPFPANAALDAPKPPRPEYRYPPLDLLAEPEEYDLGAINEKIAERGEKLESVFKSFGVEVKVVGVQTGPVLSQYEIQLKKGLRVKRIHELTSDLEIAMKAPRVRIVSPLPGKDSVGVELPNETRQLVRLREVMEECAAQAEKMAIPIFLGKDVVGSPMVADLAKLPHLLIAGRTGTGKSVCLNSIIMSILLTRGPDDVKLILIDPKMVELSPYKSVPHLMHPVVVDMQKAEAILEWAVEKMEDRYRILARAGARQLSEFNKLSPEVLRRRVNPRDEEEWAAFPKSMPSVVIVADEMADLVMTAGKDVERHIVRLAQKSRAVGIHLVLATQKPTVDVVTGLIKSNLPARIAFGVASRTDSQVVLDAKGAEQLLGNGDMLFLLPGTSQLVRGQGTFVSDKEIDAVIESIAVDEPEFEIDLPDPSEAEAEEGGGEVEYDEYYISAVDTVIAEGRASTSLLQRKFGIGYNRAARIVDAMTAEGIVTPPNPAKPSRPRDVLITLEQWRGRGAESAPGFAPPAESSPSGGAPTDFDAAASPTSGGFNPAPRYESIPDAESTYRPTAYESTPIASPESRAAERASLARARAEEYDLSPARDETSRRTDVADRDVAERRDAESSRRPGASRRAEPSPRRAAPAPQNGGWNAEQWAKYLDYDDELDADSDAGSNAGSGSNFDGESADFDDFAESGRGARSASGASGVDLREAARTRRDRRGR